MIRESLLLIANELNEYVDSVQNGVIDKDTVVLNNIGLMDSGLNSGGEMEKMKTSITLTLIGVREEQTLKNGPNTTLENGKTVYKNRPVHLNLFLLFSAGSKVGYSGSLDNLSRIVRFFQGKPVYTIQDIKKWDIEWIDTEDIRLVIELYSMTFEEQNYVWSTLGGKQFPHVCYKLRLIQLERQVRQDERGVIKEVSVGDHQI